MKILTAYYSFEGHAKCVAEEISAALKELGEVHTFRIEAEKEPPHSGMKYLVGGYNALKQAATKIKPVTVNVNEYDLVILGMPVWAGNPPGAVRSFIEQAKPEGRKIILFAVSLSGNDGKTLERTAGYLGGNEIAKCISLKEGEPLDADLFKNIVTCLAEK